MATMFPSATSHGSIRQIFENIFVVQGSVVMGPGIQISRSMTVVRQNNSLTLISAIRLNEEGLKQLESLGEIKHVIRLGAYHLGHMNGMDDEFYLNRYGAKLWLLPGMESKISSGNVEELTRLHLPINQASLFIYESSPMPEAYCG